MAICNIISCCVVLVLCAVVAAYSVGNDSFTYNDRAAWGGQPPTNVRPLKTPVPYVVIHHTYIPGACYTFEDCSSSMRSMQRYHMSLGWGDIGYNFCVGTEGAAYEGRGWHTLGIHTGRANNYSIGICLIGDWREELPPPETLQTTKALISEGITLGIISSEYKVIGHQQVMSTECPGTALMTEIGGWPHFQSGHINFASAA
ncbi:hypothetical protein O0L34_g14970 [Tuta absoluta]|nr:hypothetical protein O0L34_g14970 [Tuta absoluta]